MRRMAIPGTWLKLPRVLIPGAVAGCLVVVMIAFFASRGGGKGPPGVAAPDATPEGPGLLPASALFGTGWEASATIELNAMPVGMVMEVIPAMPECAGLRALEEAFYVSNGTFDRGYTRRYPGDSGQAVTHLRVEFTDASTAGALLGAIDASLEAGEMARCIEVVARRDGSDVTASEGDLAGLPDKASGRIVRLTEGGTARVVASQVVVWWTEGAKLAAVTMVAAGGPPDGASILRVVEAAMVATREAVTE